MEQKKNGIILQKEKLSALLHKITSKYKGDFYGLNYLLEQKINVNLMAKYVKIFFFVELSCHQKRIIYSNLINI